MRRRCKGAPTRWLGGLGLAAAGLGMLLAWLLPCCIFPLGVILLLAGIWLMRR